MRGSNKIGLSTQDEIKCLFYRLKKQVIHIKMKSMQSAKQQSFVLLELSMVIVILSI